MKNNLLRLSLYVLPLFLLVGCGNDELPADGLPEPSGRILRVGALIAGGTQTRTTIDVTHPYNPNPDFSIGEAFLWESSEKVCGLIWNDTDASSFSNLSSTIISDDHKNATFEVVIPTNFSSGSCRLIYPSLAVNDNGTVDMPISNEQSHDDFALYNFMCTESLVFDEATIDIPSGSFQHLASLLRFNVYNFTERPYTIKDITVCYADGDGVPLTGIIPSSLTLDIRGGTVTNGDYHTKFCWQNTAYQTAPAMIDDESTADKHEGVYDAMMVILPTLPQATGSFQIAMTLYDKDAKAEFVTQTLVLPCASYDFLCDRGFVVGTRTYFCLDITDDNLLCLKDVQVTDWNDGGEIPGGDLDAAQ